MRFMQTESVLQTKNRSEPPKIRSSVALVYTVCIVWTHNSMVEQHSSNFRVITTKFMGVQIFRKFKVRSKTH